MKTNKPIENWIRQKKLDPDTSAAMDSRILMDSYTAMPAAKDQHKLSGYRRILMKRAISFTAAAIVLIAAFLLLTLINRTVSPAYAIEQTIAACHSVRSIHIKTTIPDKEEPILVWAEFDDNGQPKLIRLDLPDWVRDDGAKEAVWKDNVAHIWFKKYNGLLRTTEQNLAGNILVAVKRRDPKTFMQELLKEQKSGQREIHIQQPSDKIQPFLITAIRLPDKEEKLVLYIDQDTLLPIKSETYFIRDEQYHLFFTTELYDYNQPIDPNVFTFNNLPPDIIQVDQVENLVGLDQEQMTNNQVAVEVVSRFWQGVIDGNYDAAGQMIEGIPGWALKNMFKENFPVKVIKIISVFPGEWYPTQSNLGVIVPCTFELEPEMSAARSIVISCTLEIEKDGQLMEQTFDRISVGQVYNHPGRWTIFGGI